VCAYASTTTKAKKKTNGSFARSFKRLVRWCAECVPH
jgi:hypothetical protein